MKKAWKIGISTIAGIVGACVLIRIHNAEVRKVYCERYGKGYDAGYALGLYQGKLKGANDMYMNGELEWDHKDMPLAPRLYRAHTCPNGDIGVGDFIGYQKEEQ